jgi:shikimate dehydrogenase
VSRGIALGVLGDPLAYTRSPVLHRAGLASLGLAGSSAALRTRREELGLRLRELAAHGYRGVNLTTPLKQAALDHLERVSDLARRSRSVNTVGFGDDGAWGETTDGAGFVDLLATLGRDPARERVSLLGGGGVARSVALALRTCGAGVTAYVRRPEAVGEWSEIDGAVQRPWASRDELAATDATSVLVNTTPVEPPFALELLSRRTLILDLRYGSEVGAWIRSARAAGFEAYDGLGLLVFQARRSLALWLSRPVAVDPLARAVGWPR